MANLQPKQVAPSARPDCGVVLRSIEAKVSAPAPFSAGVRLRFTRRSCFSRPARSGCRCGRGPRNLPALSLHMATGFRASNTAASANKMQNPPMSGHFKQSSLSRNRLNRRGILTALHIFCPVPGASAAVCCCFPSPAVVQSRRAKCLICSSHRSLAALVNIHIPALARPICKTVAGQLHAGRHNHQQSHRHKSWVASPSRRIRIRQIIGKTHDTLARAKCVGNRIPGSCPMSIGACTTGMPEGPAAAICLQIHARSGKVTSKISGGPK